MTSYSFDLDADSGVLHIRRSILPRLCLCFVRERIWMTPHTSTFVPDEGLSNPTSCCRRGGVDKQDAGNPKQVITDHCSDASVQTITFRSDPFPSTPGQSLHLLLSRPRIHAEHTSS